MSARELDAAPAADPVAVIWSPTETLAKSTPDTVVSCIAPSFRGGVQGRPPPLVRSILIPQWATNPGAVSITGWRWLRAIASLNPGISNLCLDPLGQGGNERKPVHWCCRIWFQWLRLLLRAARPIAVTYNRLG